MRNSIDRLANLLYTSNNKVLCRDEVNYASVAQQSTGDVGARGGYRMRSGSCRVCGASSDKYAAAAGDSHEYPGDEYANRHGDCQSDSDCYDDAHAAPNCYDPAYSDD